jgi:hypothetical protein
MQTLFYALSLTQPWATLSVLGLKEWETRSWLTLIRGTVFIHAAGGFPTWAKEHVHQREFKDALAPFGITAASLLPTGGIIGKVDIVGCEQTYAVVARISRREQAFGDYHDGRFAFEMKNPVAFKRCYPCKGFQKFWRFSRMYPELLETIRREEGLSL